MKAFVVVLLALSLAACETTNGLNSYTLSNGKVITETMVISKCPALKQYTPEQLQKAADELGGLPSDSVIAAMIADYGKTREACRAISKQLQKK
jgi:predicted small secreted protein